MAPASGTYNPPEIGLVGFVLASNHHHYQFVKKWQLDNNSNKVHQLKEKPTSLSWYF
jgi:hypothetical protein